MSKAAEAGLAVRTAPLAPGRNWLIQDEND